MGNESVYRKIVEEISPCECMGKYCFYKILFSLSKYDQRALAQLKCIEKYKWEINKSYSSDIGWDKAVEMWIEKGHAESYALLYNENLTANEIYDLMFPKTGER